MRRWLLLLLVLFIGLAGAPAADAYKGTVTIALAGEAPTMDPHTDSGFVGNITWRFSYDTLMHAQTGTGTRVPWLATKWERLSPTKLKIYLRKGVKFTDGTPFTAKNVVFSLGRQTAPGSRQRSYWKSLNRIEVLDDHTIIYHSNGPDNGFINRAARWTYQMSLNAKGKDKATISRNTFGTGPYILKSWTKGQRMVFEANPTWWANDRYPDRPKTIILRRIRESTTRVKALMTGEVDVIMTVLPQFVPQIEKNPNTEIVTVPAVRILYIGFHTRHGGPLTDRNVRLAINHAIDSELIRKTIVGGRADPIGQLYHPWNFSGYNPNKTWYGYDLAKAKEYLKKSAYPNGFEGEIFTPIGRYPGDKQSCEAVAGMLRKINLKITCNPGTYTIFRKKFRAYQKGKMKGKAGMYFQGYGNGTGDAALVMRSTCGCNGAWSGHCFPDLDAQIDKAATMGDPKQQQIEFEKVTDMIKEKATHKIFYKIHDVFGISKRIKFIPRHDETITAWDIVVKK